MINITNNVNPTPQNNILVTYLKVLLLSFIQIANTSEANDTTSQDYRLVWADEFEVDGKPNPDNWGYEHGLVRNNEFQWYQPENAFVKNGLLVIQGRRELRLNNNYQRGNKDWKRKREFVDYTSASLNTKGLHSWKYGRFEVRARISTQPGLWPAIWFLGVDGMWPDNGEIDLMEYYNGHILANACWGTGKRGVAKWDISKTKIREFENHNWANNFHIWRMEWNSEAINLYLDDNILNTIDLTETINPTTEHGPKNPFQQPHYMLINLAIGGNQGGDPTTTLFPTSFEIDYVRVYQK